MRLEQSGAMPLSVQCASHNDGTQDGGARPAAAHDPRWYLVQTKCRAERRIAQRLGWAGYATALPLVAEPRRDRIRRQIMHTAWVPCFPGFVFVALDLDRDRLSPVLHCEGVKRMMLDTLSRPQPVRRGVVERLMDEADDRRVQASATLQGLARLAEGSRVRLTAGPFQDHLGRCLWCNADRVGLLMEVLGGLHEVVATRAQVEAA